jgi:hypothetical protein
MEGIYLRRILATPGDWNYWGCAGVQCVVVQCRAVLPGVDAVCTLYHKACRGLAVTHWSVKLVPSHTDSPWRIDAVLRTN